MSALFFKGRVFKTGWWFNCSSLKDLYIPDTVTEIGEYAFSGCSNLRTIPIGVDSIQNAGTERIGG